MTEPHDPAASAPLRDASSVTRRPVVVVTGASSGIGRATALAFAERGAAVVLAARGQEALETVAVECRHSGGPALVIATDVTDAEAVHALADAAIARFGRIDVWVNGVGVGAVGRFEDTPVAAHRRVIEANLLGHLYGAHAAIPHFRKRGQGTLVNMISVGGWIPSPYASSYTASKFGLRGLSESLRAELSDAPHIHVCDVVPTFVDTPGISHGANYTGSRLRPPPPLIDPREVAAAVVALLERPRPVTWLGAPAHPGRLAHALAPGLLGATMRRLMDIALRRADPVPVTDGNLFTASRNAAVDGGYRQAMPGGKAIASVAAGAAAVALVAWLAGRRSGGR